MTDFGRKLRQARERRGVSLRQIAVSTKIAIGALEALERNDFSRLPGGIFSRGFVRSYALEVGLDPDETVREFLEECQGAPAADGPPQRLHATTEAGRSDTGSPPVRSVDDEGAFESRQRMASVLIKIIVVSFVVAAIILYLTWRQAADRSRPLPSDQPRSTQHTPTRGVTQQVPWIPASDRR